MNNYRIGFLGECMVELKGDPRATLSHGYAGDTLNTALYFARLTPGQFTTHFITALGEDAFSSHMQALWRDEGIDNQFVKIIKGLLPGIYAIETDAAGERRFHYWRNQSAAKHRFDEVSDTDTELENLDAIYLSGISLAILTERSREYLWQLLEKVKARGGKVYFDNNYRPALWPNKDTARAAYNQVLARCDKAFLTFDDEQALFGSESVEQVLERIAPFDIEETIIKCGSEPCVIESGGERVSVPAVIVDKVVDTTAAGDSFSAGYLAARLQGASASRSAEYAHQLAARVIQYPGAILPASVTQAFLTECSL